MGIKEQVFELKRAHMVGQGFVYMGRDTYLQFVASREAGESLSHCYGLEVVVVDRMTFLKVGA